MHSIALGLLLAATPELAADQVFRCKGPDGKIAFQDRPCEHGHTEEAVAIAPPPRAQFGAASSNAMTILDATCDLRAGWSRVQGLVRNDRANRAEFVEIVAYVEDSAGVMLRSASGFARLTPLLPGQTSPFQVTMRTDEKPHACSVSGVLVDGKQVNVQQE